MQPWIQTMLSPSSFFLAPLFLYSLASLSEVQKTTLYRLDTSSNELKWECMETLQGVSKVHCVVSCLYTNGCVSVHYNSSSTTCLLLKPQSLCSSSGWTLPENGEIFRSHEETLVKLDVFRVSSGLGSKVYDAWTRSSYQSSCNAAVYDLHEKINFAFKHPIVQHWSTLKKHEVHLTLWKNATQVARIVFDGRDSTVLSWFSHSRILQTSFTDLMGLNNSMVSLTGYRQTRRFYVAYEHRGCHRDTGWVCVVEKERSCAWESYPTYPALLYSTSGRYIQWQSVNELGLADDMVISLIIEI